MRLFTLILLFFSTYLYAQNPDSLIQRSIQNELEAIKIFRQKDSIRIAMLLNEIQEMLHTEIPNKLQNKDSLATLEKKKEIENLREKMRGKPIVFEKDTLYYIYTSYGPYDAEIRVKNTEDKLKKLYDDPFFIADSIKVKPSGDYLAVMYKGKSIAGISVVDALWENSTQTELANRYANVIKNTIIKYKEQNSLKSILIRLSEICLVLFIAFVLVWAINKLFRFLQKLAINSQDRFVSGIKVKNYEIIKKRSIIKVILRILAILRIIFLFLLLVTIIPLVFEIFPSTQYLSHIIIQWISEPIKNVGKAILNYLPHLFNIVIIVIITRYVLKVLRFFALEIERGILKIHGFHPEWAHTTYVLIRMIL